MRSMKPARAALTLAATGTQVLTLRFLDKPVLNFDYMEFVRVP
jgi:hypothetical protein